MVGKVKQMYSIINVACPIHSQLVKKEDENTNRFNLLNKDGTGGDVLLSSRCPVSK